MERYRRDVIWRRQSQTTCTPLRTALRATDAPGDALTFGGDSGGENFSIHIDSTGTLRADGTIAGMRKAHFVDFNDAHDVVRKRDQEITGRPWARAPARTTHTQ